MIICGDSGHVNIRISDTGNETRGHKTTHLTWIPVLILDGLHAVLDPGRVHDFQETRDALQGVCQSEGAECPWGGDPTEFAAHRAETEQVFGLVLSLQTTLVLHIQIQVLGVEIKRNDVDDGMYDVRWEKWYPFRFCRWSHGPGSESVRWWGELRRESSGFKGGDDAAPVPAVGVIISPSLMHRPQVANALALCGLSCTAFGRDEFIRRPRVDRNRVTSDSGRSLTRPQAPATPPVQERSN